MSSYQIYEFDGVALPLYGQSQDLGSGTVKSTLIMGVGGAVDWAASLRKLPMSQQLTVSGAYAAEVDGDFLVDDVGDFLVDESGNYLVLHTARADLRAQVDAIKALIGVRGTLRRKRFDDETVTQWRTVRMLDARERGQADERGMRASIDCIFEADRTGWRGATQRTANISSNGLVDVYGNLPVRNGVLTVTATGGGVTAVAVRCVERGINWAWAGVLASGQSLVVDNDARTVLAAGLDDYDGLTLGSSHTAEGWLDLESGANVVVVTVTGSASAVSLAWWDVFA